jgi:hypothetical protein
MKGECLQQSTLLSQDSNPNSLPQKANRIPLTDQLIDGKLIAITFKLQKMIIFLVTLHNYTGCE